MALSGAGHPVQPRQELSDSVSDAGLSGDETSNAFFESFSNPQTVLKLSSMLLEFVYCWQQPLLLWRQLLAVVSSLSSIVPGSRLRMRSLQLRFNAAGCLLPDSALVDWDDSCLADLQWWSVESHLLVGLPLDLLQSGPALYTDASDSGWGLFLADDHLSGLWSPEFSRYSINHRELLVVLYGVLRFLPVLRSHSVSLFLDDTTALSYLRNQGGWGRTHSTLNSVAQAILRFCEDNQLFRQNTYLQNKKHTLTCQGGTGCYRFNFQPGS